MPVNSYDNHPVHILYHNRYRKTQEFENLPDEAKKVFEEHVQAHQTAMQVGVTPAQTDGAYEGYAQTSASGGPPVGGGAPQGSPGGMSAPGGMMGVLGMKGSV